MQSFEEKAKEYYPEKVINKGYTTQLGLDNKPIPTYVSEWIIAHFLGDSTELSEDIKKQIVEFITKHLPGTNQQNALKNQLRNEEIVELLDHYKVSVDLQKNRNILHIPYLKDDEADINPQIVGENNLLLKSGIWGVGTLEYIPPPPSPGSASGSIIMNQFRPLQVASLDLAEYIEGRKHFTTEEWIDLIISSMGYNPANNTPEINELLMARAAPMVEQRLNLIEPAPKGTGKSHLFKNLTWYATVIDGGRVSPAILFYDKVKKEAGLFLKHSLVVLDELQSIRSGTDGELISLLKGSLESGTFTRGRYSFTSSSGLVMLANVEMNENNAPRNIEEGLFKEFPNFLQESAFLDRIHCLIPGWKLPRIASNTPSQSVGFKGDYFAEILESLRDRLEYENYARDRIDIKDMRNKNAVHKTATAYLKLIFPDLNVTEDEFKEYCLKPACKLRQGMWDELCKIDDEFKPFDITSAALGEAAGSLEEAGASLYEREPELPEDVADMPSSTEEKVTVEEIVKEMPFIASAHELVDICQDIGFFHIVSTKTAVSPKGAEEIKRTVLKFHRIKIYQIAKHIPFDISGSELVQLCQELGFDYITHHANAVDLNEAEKIVNAVMNHFGGEEAPEESPESDADDTSQEPVPETTPSPLGKSCQEILKMLKEDPYNSSSKMAENLDITESGVKYHLKNLKKSGHIKRVGPTRGGRWKVVEK